MTSSNEPTQCCPPFLPDPWHDHTFDWSNKPFIRASVCTLFYMPLNFGGAIKRLTAITGKAGAATPDWLCLADHTSKWNMDLYLAVDKPVAGADNHSLSGRFYSRVYDGPFKDIGKWTDDFKKQALQKGLNISKFYLWYTTCPKCAKKYGKNFVVILAPVS